MKVNHLINDFLLFAVDTAMAIVPRPRPEPSRLRNCRLIAHRGGALESGGRLRENTLEAFEKAVENGAWGIEFDIRWTSDEIPVVHHDPDCRRVFAKDHVIHRSTFSELRKSIPEIPTLEEVLAKMRGRAHLLIELKKTEEGLSRDRVLKLQKLLEGLEPVVDYHFMSLDKKSLLALDFVPRQALIAIATWNVEEMSEFSIAEKIGAFTGQYLLIKDEVLFRQKASGALVGSGFISSKSVLYRELNRGVDWIFTNHVQKVSQILRESLK